MKILVATEQTQGQRESDFCFVPEDEPLLQGFMCHKDEVDPNPDGGCGCGRALIGILCQKGTTSFKVVETQLSQERFIQNYISSFQDSGWLTGPNKLDKEFIEGLRADGEQLIEVATRFPLGAILEKRKEAYQQRL